MMRFGFALLLIIMPVTAPLVETVTIGSVTIVLEETTFAMVTERLGETPSRVAEA
jgi:hypothetical protein